MDNLREKLHALIAPVLQNFNADFVALELKGSKSNMVVRVVVDQDGGITLPTCAAISRALSDEFDAADIIPGRYRLEVSSPGVDWPLKTRRDFQRHLGRQVNLRYCAGPARLSVEGTIASVSDTEVVIASEEGSVVVPLSNIEVGKIKLQW
ncbi:MAG: ribosome maturation factor RimP [candidate division KSB1 bacterium]|nr:ribosome maturation factor RimP [candidate division KSB1 bacterium]MDZ7303496.1 ribosome maturation factor RimP [candidate division KSB1 bacterium]MDZ7312702.1 ribosome maturation factor RimP [candidate division KSB1 bacterium]